jgi:hypothetical protein
MAFRICGIFFLMHTNHGDAETKIILPLSLMKAHKHHTLISINGFSLTAKKKAA